MACRERRRRFVTADATGRVLFRFYDRVEGESVTSTGGFGCSPVSPRALSPASPSLPTDSAPGCGDERGQGTVEYAGLAMAIGVLLLAVGSYLGGKDHGIGAVVTDAVKSAIKHAVGSGK